MKLITGRPHRLLSVCIDRIQQLSSAGENCMFLVPSQYTLQAEVELMTNLSLNGTFLIDVLSPGRLQSRIFERAGYPKETAFDERGKCMVLSAIIEEEKDNLIVYRAAAQSGSLGLAQKMSSIIADFKRSKTSPQMLELAIEQMRDEHPGKAKLTDISRIYAIYEARMQGKLADSEDIANAAREKMKRSGVLDGQHVFVYGFDMITPTFAADLIAMEESAKSLTIAIETDKNSAADGRLFAPVNASIDRLVSMAKERNITAEREEIHIHLDAAPTICEIERKLFSLGAEKTQSAAEGVTLSCASNPRTEAHLAASKIKQLLYDKNDPSDIAVFYPKGGVYEPLISNILPMYGIPVYTAIKRNAANHPLCRFILSTLNVISGGWRTADLIETIQSGFLALTAEEADMLCRYAEGEDLRQNDWKHPFTHIKKEHEENLEALNHARDQVITPLTDFAKSISSSKTADDTVKAILSLLEKTNAFETLENMRDQLSENGFEIEAEDCVQVWNRLMETLDQLHTLLGGEAVAAQNILTLLESGLSAMELSALPPADGAVICGEIGNIRTTRVNYLFLLGMNDDAAVSDNGLLSAQESEEASRATGAYLGMSAAQRTALAQLDLLKAITYTKKELHISYSLADETGRALREGNAIHAIKRLYPSLSTQNAQAKEELEALLCAEKSATLALSVLMSDAADGRETLSEKAKQAYAALKTQTAENSQLMSITRSLGDPVRSPLSSAQARTLYGRPVMSVSRLETFAQCPYRHFVRYGLSPQEEQKPGVDRAELGTIYHEAADAFTRAVTQLPEFPNIPAEVCDKLMNDAIAPLIEDWRKSPLGKSARGKSIAGRIEKTARRAGRNIVSQFAQSGFAPLHSEFIFGQRGMAPIVLELADGTLIYLQGRIDRVDVMDGDGRIRVVDYKSGTKKFDPTMVYWGLQLQLLIYLAAALSQIPGSKAAGFFYCRIADPLIRSESRVKEEIEKQIAKKLSLAGISLSDISVLRAQGESHAAMITREGKPNGRYAGSMVDEEGMNRLVAYAKKKACSLAQEAYEGLIDDSPIEHGQQIACALCDYAAICGFDPTRKKHRRLAAKKLEDLF